MSLFSCIGQNLKINEGTTHYFSVSIVDDEGNPKDLTDYQCVFTLKSTDEEITYDIACSTDSNEVYLTLPKEDTVGYKKAEFQIRAFKDEEVYQLVQGKITIVSAVEPYLDNPIT